MSPTNNPMDGHQPDLKEGACGKSLGTHGFQEKLCEKPKGHDGECGFAEAETTAA